SKPRSEAEAELFHLVVAFLDNREGQIDTDRPERRPPGDTDTSRYADGIVIDQYFIQFRISDSVHIVQSTGIHKCMTSNPEFIRQTDWESQFGTDAGKLVAAKGVVTDQLARTNAGRRE